MAKLQDMARRAVIRLRGPVIALRKAGRNLINGLHREGSVELIETDMADALDDQAGESGGGKPRDDGFHSVTLWLSEPTPTARVLTDLFGYEGAGHETGDGVERLRFRSPSRGRGSVVDLVRSDARSIGRQGAGTIHHVAFRAEDDAAQQE